MTQFDETITDLDAQLDAIQREMAAVETEGRDRRGCERFNYASVQWIAPCDGIQFPTKRDFSQVRCNDISQGGISFLWSTPFDLPYVIVKLRPLADSIYLMAEVKRCEPVGGLRDTFLVGCQFLNRIKVEA